MRQLLFFCSWMISITLTAQEKMPTTKVFTVSGDVKEELTITQDQILRQPISAIGDVVITNHAGEVKGVAKNMKGAKLRDLLVNLKLVTDNPKLNSTYYFVVKAADGYTVVFSWNEIFNTPVGDKLFLVTAKDGKDLAEMPDRLLLISAADLKTGRRFVKGLAEIIVKRVS